MQAIILAAGRGSRLKGLTDDKPKCMNTIGDKPLIEWQTNAFNKCGIEDIVIVTGYMGSKLEQYGTVRICNEMWHKSNMVKSLLCARQYVNDQVIISYSDILYGTEPVLKLMASNEDLSIIYDNKWETLWTQRFDNPADDAESFHIDQNNRVTEIGQRLNDVSSVPGQYIGLLKFNSKVFSWIDKLEIEKKIDVMKSDMTSLLQVLIENQYPVHGISIEGGWCEIDNPKDLSIATELYESGNLKLID